MSDVTNVIVVADGAIDNVQWLSEQLNQYWTRHDRLPSAGELVSVKDASLPRHWYGGGKNLECHIFIGACNHLDLEAFVAHLRAIDWSMYNDCYFQLFVCEQEDDGFRLIDIRRPQWADIK